MRLSDTVSGLLVLIFGIAVVVHARTFPPMPGQPIGPGFFPTAIGGALALTAAVLIAAGARRRSRPLVQLDAWVRKPRLASNFVLVLADVLFYAVAVDRLGFLITAIVFLSALFFAFGVNRARILPLAVAATFAIHYGFYTLLRVPLPWGVLAGFAW